MLGLGDFFATDVCFSCKLQGGFTVHFIFSDRWQCDRALMIPLGEKLPVLFDVCYFLC